jgi:hypothetical protein
VAPKRIFMHITITLHSVLHGGSAVDSSFPWKATMYSIVTKLSFIGSVLDGKEVKQKDV